MSRIRSARWLLALLPACFHPSYDHPACGPGDACPSGLSCSAAGFCEGSDAGLGLDAPAGDSGGATVHVCLGTFVDVCADAPAGLLSLMTQTIDTSSSALCLPYTVTPLVDACVIASSSIAIPSGNTVSVTGAKRLILFASESLTIAGALDAASHRGGLGGPAADTGPCPTNFTDPTVSGQGGGGWGGTFGKPGNNGGNTPGGGLGGIVGSALTITALGGGCPGGKGAGTSGGSGGSGGGSVLLLAGQSITIAGIVNASGAGGSGSKKGTSGGGGGGAGGMIVLEAPFVTISGQCFANGGGGGQGSSDITDGNGGGESSAPDKAGGGGSGGSTVGGDGGAGGFGSMGSAPGGSGTHTDLLGGHDGGGGAGGGGVGIIKIVSGSQSGTSDLTKVSPPPR